MFYKYPFLEVLNDFLPVSRQFILVGGWVPTVYFEYLWNSDKSILKTKDVDIALTAKIKGLKASERKLDERKYQHKHLHLGKEKPYQLILRDNTPIDFLADVKESSLIAKKILGDRIILNGSLEYSFLLKDNFVVTCEGLKIRVPRPARYILHKIFIYFHDRHIRTKDLVTAYYCLSRSPHEDEIFTEIHKLKKTKVAQTVQGKLKKLLLEDPFSLTTLVKASLKNMGILETDEDIKNCFKKLVG